MRCSGLLFLAWVMGAAAAGASGAMEVAVQTAPTHGELSLAAAAAAGVDAGVASASL